MEFYKCHIYIVYKNLKYLFFMTKCYKKCLLTYLLNHNFLHLYLPSYRKAKRYLYIRNLKYTHLTHIFRLHNIYLVLSTCPQEYKWILCTEKQYLDFWCTKIINHLLFFLENRMLKYIFSILNKEDLYTVRNKAYLSNVIKLSLNFGLYSLYRYIN